MLAGFALLGGTRSRGQAGGWSPAVPGFGERRQPGLGIQFRPGLSGSHHP